MMALVKADHCHSIEAVSRKTGLSQDVIRIWERRYCAVEPLRTPTNRRLYSDQDIHKLRLLASATRSGYPIGQVAHLSPAELEALDNTAYHSPRPPGPDDPVQRALEAAQTWDSAQLQRVLETAAAELTTPRLLNELVVPLLERVGEGWRRGNVSISTEHLITACLRSLLGQQVQSRHHPRGAPVVVVATPAGQQHELGALMAALTASEEGWSVVYLGPDLPAQEIARAAAQVRARAVALSLVYPPDDPQLAGELRRLRQLLENGVAILVGGRSARGYLKSNLSGIRWAESLDDLRHELDACRR